MDKLAMAYLKSGDYEKSIDFIMECHESGDISSSIRDDMIERMNSLKEALPYIPIARDLEATKINLSKVLSIVKPEDNTLFITIITALVADYETGSTGLIQSQPA